MSNGTTARFSSQRRRVLTAAEWPGVPVARPFSAADQERMAEQASVPPTLEEPLVSGSVGGLTKRSFDLAAAVTALVLLLPLLLLIAVAIKLWDPGPVFYRHKRIGRNGVPFDCLKFRTMVVGAEAALARHLDANPDAAREWHEKHKLTNDPRVTALGGALRRTSLDELPQLFNIIMGEMSVVGPRPIVAAEIPKYGECIAHYMRARPGLTGPWQVSGRNDVDYAKRVLMDRYYVETWNMWRDLFIVVCTLRVIVTARGCY